MMNHSIMLPTQQLIDSLSMIITPNKINILNKDGYVTASTDSYKIGLFRKIGLEVMKTKRDKELIDANDAIIGKISPIFIDGKSIGAIEVFGNRKSLNSISSFLTLVTNQFIQQTQQIAEFQRRKELVEDITDIIYGEQSELDTELSHLMDRMDIKINFPATVISIATEEESEFPFIYQQLISSNLMTKANDIVLKRDTEYIIIKSQLEDPDYYLDQILENEEKFNLKIKNVSAGSPANNFKEIFSSFKITQIYKKSIWNYKKYNALDPDQLILIEFDKNNNNEDLIKPYVDQLIKKLDKMSSVWLYPTIDAYFLTDGRIQGMADKLNIHKNSCIYRVYKILNALELENARTFTVAYFLGRILQYKQPDLHKEN
ncbi:MAG: sugar diacid recognition domain-containing protein [Sphaerochaeta sp.]